MGAVQRSQPERKVRNMTGNMASPHKYLKDAEELFQFRLEKDKCLQEGAASLSWLPWEQAWR